MSGTHPWDASTLIAFGIARIAHHALVQAAAALPPSGDDALLPHRVASAAVAPIPPAAGGAVFASRRARRAPAAPDCLSRVPVLRGPVVAADYPVGTCRTNACTAVRTRP